MSFTDRPQSDGFGGRRHDQQAATPLPSPSSDAPYGTRTIGASGDLVVQLDRGGLRGEAAAGPDPSAAVKEAAAQGTSGAAGALPHLDSIQRSFGRHDVSGVQAHCDGAARDGAAAMGAEAFATGDHVAFAGSPSLHTAAHEAAHVVQQRAGVHLKGGVGAEGDVYERQADAVAERVVAGESAESMLDDIKPAGGASSGAVQRFVRQDAGANWGGLGKAMKVSDDGKMAVQDIALYPQQMGRAHQEFYATPDVAQASAGKLGELQSVYEIALGAALDPQTTGGLTLHRVIASNKAIGDPDAHGNATPLNCDDNTRQFLGVNTLTQEDSRANQLGATLSEKHGFFGKRRDVDVEMTPEESFDKAKGQATRLVTGKNDRDEANTKYENMSDKATDKEAEKVGINQFAKAGLGGAYGVWGKSGRHFAPILAVSGDDEVALEAHVHDKTTQGPAQGEIAPSDKNDYNPEWYFQMYGPVKKDRRGKVTDDQTFYGQHQEQYPDDDALMVVAFHKLDTAKLKNDDPAEKRRLVQHVVDACNRSAQRTIDQTAGNKFDGIRNEIAATVAPLRKNPDTIPDQHGQYANFLDTWAQLLDQAQVDQAIQPPLADVIAQRLRSGAREIRKAKNFIG